jgi:peroxiredoxin
MKKTFFIRTGFFFAALLILSIPSLAQNAIEILKKSYVKCQSVQNGYYEMEQHMKFPGKNDTSLSSFACHFKKLKDDSIYSSAFHYQQSWKGKTRAEILYTGEDFVIATTWDSTATIMSKALWAKDIKAMKDNSIFYSPLTSRKSFPMPHDSDFAGKGLTFKLVGEETVNKILCYHIRENEPPENDSADPVKTLRIEYHYWISKSDFIPIQYSTAIDMVMNNDTMYQYELDMLTRYEINNLKDESSLALNSIPSYYRMKDFAGYTNPRSLPNDTLAPAWQLISLTGEKVSLNDLKGKLVLIDFFYKSCYPCMQAVPELQALNEKYKDKNFVIIGVDPFDKKEDYLAASLDKRGVTYTVLYGSQQTTNDYHVAAYPTMYLIDKNGRIVFSQVGFSKELEKTLEENIIKNLN